MRISQVSVLSLLLSLGSLSTAIASPLTEITLHRDAVRNQEISAGNVRVLLKSYEPRNYETSEEGSFTYEIYVNDDLKAEVSQDTADFLFADLSLQNLDPDGVPEVIFHQYTGGAHCCSLYTLHSWQGDRLHRTHTRFLDASASGGFTDLDNDGYSEFMTADVRFLYAFSSYAASWPPTIILSFQNGTLVDVTREFPDLLRSRAYSAYEFTRDATPENPVLGANGILAGYAAQKILLNEYEAGWNYMLAHYDPTDDWGLIDYDTSGEVSQVFEDYPTALSSFLTELGYLTLDGTPNPNLDLSQVIIESESEL